jgi:hypothetical protein
VRSGEEAPLGRRRTRQSAKYGGIGRGTGRAEPTSIMHLLRTIPLSVHVTTLCALLSVLSAAPARAAETITATAHVKSAGGAEATAPVRIVIDKLTTDAERDEVMAALKKDGTEGVRKLLTGRPKIGSVQVGATNTAVQYAYARATGGGRLITLITGSPIAFIGAGLPNAPPKAGFDLGLVLIEVPATGQGRGEIDPASKIKLNAEGAIVTDGYSGEMVQLTNVSKP